MLKRKETLDFYSILISQTQVVCDTVRALCAFCENPTTEKGDFVKAKEREADQVHYQLVEAINHTFITPIDRDDLFRLSSSIDDFGGLRLDDRQGSAYLRYPAGQKSLFHGAYSAADGRGNSYLRYRS